jgi:hypothetical protein
MIAMGDSVSATRRQREKKRRKTHPFCPMGKACNLFSSVNDLI